MLYIKKSKTILSLMDWGDEGILMVAALWPEIIAFLVRFFDNSQLLSNHVLC